MPRTRQQPPRAAADQAYGVRGDQMTAQRQMPIPQTAPPPPSAAAGAGGGGGTPAAPPVTAAAPQPQQSPNGNPLDVLAAAVGTQGGVPLTEATTRPGEPVTAGLAVGPGEGPEALAGMFQARRDRVAETLQRLADDLGDGWMAELAMKAQQSAGRR